MPENQINLRIKIEIVPSLFFYPTPCTALMGVCRKEAGRGIRGVAVAIVGSHQPYYIRHMALSEPPSHHHTCAQTTTPRPASVSRQLSKWGDVYRTHASHEHLLRLDHRDVLKFVKTFRVFIVLAKISFIRFRKLVAQKTLVGIHVFLRGRDFL